MRSLLIFGLSLTLAAVPAAHAQQVATPPPVAQPVAGVVEAPVPRLLVDETRARAVPVEAREAVAAEAAREMTARTLLALVGAAVLVVALVVLLR